MKLIPHPHRCACGRVWDCNNPHCTDLEHKWCVQPGCTPTETLRRLEQLQIGGHMLHQVEHYLRQQGETNLADSLASVRASLLARIEQIGAEAFGDSQA